MIIMDKFEYLTIEHKLGFGINIKINDFQAKLKELGSDGWDLVSSFPTALSGTTQTIVSIFKRKIIEGE